MTDIDVREIAARVIHDNLCQYLPHNHQASIFCARYDDEAAAILAAIEPTIRTDERQKVAEEIAYDIRAELVCCGTYDMTRDTERAGDTHEICFWGEAGARIAEAHWQEGDR